MKETDCRNRFFEAYISTQVEYVEKISQKIFNIMTRIFQKHISLFFFKTKVTFVFGVLCILCHLLNFLQNQEYYRVHKIYFRAERMLILRKNFQSFFVTNMLVKKE